MEYDVVIIGAGAAGLMAAGTAAETGRRALLLEKMEKAGRKIRITGKGRCNVTNMRPHEEFLKHVRWRSRFFTPAFEAFDNQQTFDFFTSLGVKLEVERGERVFPESGNAWEIADALVQWCERAGVEIRYHCPVTEITADEGRITGVVCQNDRGEVETIACPNVIVCTGGVSYPATGSTGDGYGFAHALGHEIAEVRPSLVPLVCTLPESRSLHGVQLRNVNAKLLVDRKIRGEEFGELEFTEWGVTGPVVLRLSRNAVDGLIDGLRVTLTIDLKPALTPEQLTARIERELAALPPTAQAYDLLRKLVPGGVAAAVSKKLRISRRAPIREFTPPKREALAAFLKDFVLPVTDYRPFEEAIITAGGVDVDRIDMLSMQSRIVAGLYFAGEVLDIDADTGGYNLQIAFSTGRLAGQLKSAARPGREPEGRNSADTPEQSPITHPPTESV